MNVLNYKGLTVEYTIGRAEPDVGIMSDYIDDLDVLTEEESIYELLSEDAIETIEDYIWKVHQANCEEAKYERYCEQRLA